MLIDGSSPSGIIFLCDIEASVEKSGVLATLSRWRPWVQIPSGALSVSGIRGRPSRREICVGWALACLGGCNPPTLAGIASSTLAQRIVNCPVDDSARSSSGLGCQGLNLTAWVRFPYGSLGIQSEVSSGTVRTLVPYKSSGLDALRGPAVERPCSSRVRADSL